MEQLKSDLERSSINNRHLLIFYLLALTYFLIIVASTTDMLLLLPESRLVLPILNVELDLLKFYIVAPFIVVMIHFHLLFCLYQHSKLLKAWQRVCTERPFGCDPELCQKNPAGVWHFPSFLFNYLICPKEYTCYVEDNIAGSKKGKVKKLPAYYSVRVLAWIVIYFYPLFLLVYFQWRFADYRNLTTTFISHFTTIVIDFFLLRYYWQKIIDLAPAEEQEKRFREQEVEFREHEKKFRKQEAEFRKHEKKFREQETEFREHEKKFREQEAIFREQKTKFWNQITSPKYLFLYFIKKLFLKAKEQEERFREQEATFRKQEATFKEQEATFREQKTKFREQEAKFREQEAKFKKQEATFREQEATFREQKTKFRKQETRFKGQKTKFWKQDTPPKYRFLHSVKKPFSWAYNKIHLCYQNAGILNTLVFVLLSIFQVLTFGVILALDVVPHNLAYRWIREYNLPVPYLRVTEQNIVDAFLGTKNSQDKINFEDSFDLKLEQLECGRNPIKIEEGSYNNWCPCDEGEKQKNCPNIRDEKFMGKRLDLKNRDLRFADFSGANLDMADLNGAKLQGCKLKNSRLRGALFKGAKMQWANLENAQLWCADLSKTQLQSASLRSADLQKAILDKANLDGADLTNANLYSSYLHGAKMNGAVLFKADLNQIRASRISAVAADLNNANFEGAVLNDAILTLVNLESSVLKRADLNGADLNASNLKQADLTEAKLKGAELIHSDLRAAKLEETDFRGARLQHSRLEGAKWINDDNFSGAQMFNVSISEKDIILSKNTEEIAADRCNEYEELLEKCELSEAFMGSCKEIEGSNKSTTEQKSTYNISFTCETKADAELVEAPKGQDNFLSTCAVAKKVRDIICSDVSTFSKKINESKIDEIIKDCNSPKEIIIHLEGANNLDPQKRNSVANKIMKDFYYFKYLNDKNRKTVKEHFEERGVRFDSPKVPRIIAERDHSMQLLRQKFACSDFYIAKGVFRQLLFDKQMEWARESLYMHMNANCPEIANFILPP